MAEREPPKWDKDSLSKYFADAEYNERVTAINYPDVFDVLRRMHRAFEHAEKAVEKGFTRGQFSISRILLPRSHSAVLAAIRLSMSGQSEEAHGVFGPRPIGYNALTAKHHQAMR